MKNFRNALPYIHLVTIVFCMICSVYVITLDTIPMPKIISGIALVALAFALHYTYNNFSKKAALSYKTFMIICAVFFQACACANAVNMLSEAGKVATGISAAINCLLFGIFLLLGVAEDLGKKKSFALCCIAQLLTLFGLVFILYATKGVFRGGDATGTVMAARNGIRLALAGVASMMISFKYQDKAERGTK